MAVTKELIEGLIVTIQNLYMRYKRNTKEKEQKPVIYITVLKYQRNTDHIIFPSQNNWCTGEQWCIHL